MDNDGNGGFTRISASTSEKRVSGFFFPRSDTSSSNSGNEESANTISNASLLDAVKSTEAILDQLMRLAVAIRKSGTGSRLQKADHSFNPKAHEGFQNHLALVLLARPSDIEDRRHAYWDTLNEDRLVHFGVDGTQLNTVQQRLVDANLRRRNRFMYAQNHARKLAGCQESSTPKVITNHGSVYQPDEETSIEPQQPVEETASTQNQNAAAMDRSKISPNALEMTATTASTVGTAIIFDSINTATAPRQTMTQVSSTGSKLTYPNPPQIGGGQNSFRCPCCCQTFPAMFAECDRWRFVEFCHPMRILVRAIWLIILFSENMSPLISALTRVPLTIVPDQKFYTLHEKRG